MCQACQACSAHAQEWGFFGFSTFLRVGSSSSCSRCSGFFFLAGARYMQCDTPAPTYTISRLAARSSGVFRSSILHKAVQASECICCPQENKPATKERGIHRDSRRLDKIRFVFGSINRSIHLILSFPSDKSDIGSCAIDQQDRGRQAILSRFRALPGAMPISSGHSERQQSQALVRAFVIWKSVLLLVVAGSSLGGPPYDTSTTLVSPRALDFNESALDLGTKLTRWDAIYFIENARRGYLFEQEWAFGSGLPFLISTVIRGKSIFFFITPSPF